MARLWAVLAALFLVGLLAVPVQAAPGGATGASAGSAPAAPAAQQCTADALAQLSADVEAARTAWADGLTTGSFADFKAARDAYEQRASACSSMTIDATGRLTTGIQDAASGGPYHVPTNGIAVDIRSQGDEVAAGLDVIYTIVATTGSGDGADSTNVSVSVTLPVAANGPEYVDNTGGCSFSSPTLTCSLGTIARGGASKSFLVRMSTPPDLFFDGTTTLVATATVSRTEADTITADNTDASSTLVTEQADLRIFKYLLPSTPLAGDTAQYTIYVENLGPSTARDVLIRDTLLAGDAAGTGIIGPVVSIQSCAFSVSQGGGNITQFTCTTGNLVATQFGTDIGTFRTNRLDPLDFNVPAADPNDPDLVVGRLRGTFRMLFNQDLTSVNKATVESPTPDPDLINNSVETMGEVLPASNLAVATTNATGEEQQTAQAGLMFNNAVFGQSLPTAPNYFASTRVTAGRRIQYTLTVTNPGASLANNVVLTDRLPAGVRIYQNSLVVSGSGHCVTGTPGDPSDPLVCNLGSIAPNANYAPIPTSATVTFQVIVDADVAAGSILENDATVGADGFELDNRDNSTFAQHTVLAAADLQALKASTGQNLVLVDGHYVFQDLANTVSAGYVLRSSITVQNNGPSDSQYVTIQDQLPAVLVANGVMPLTFLRAANADCRPDTASARDIFCSLGTMHAGERRTFDIYTMANEEVPDGTVVQNCATALSGGSNVSPPGPPANPPTGGPTGTLTWDPLTTSGNSSCTSVTINKVDDAALGLGIDKTGPAFGYIGETISYSLAVANAGPGSAKDVVVTDFMPAGLGDIVITPSQGSCVTGVPGDTSRPLVCNLGTIAAGASVSIGVDALVKSSLSAGTTIFNDVQLTSSTSDPYNGDNIDTVATLIKEAPLPDGLIRKGSGSYIGNNIYNTTGVGQSKTGQAARKHWIKFNVKIQNDGPSDSFTVAASGAATTEYLVVYYYAGIDITADIEAGTYATPVMAPGDTWVITAKVKVKKTATVGSSVTRLVTITSNSDGTRQDAVGFTGKRQ